MIDPVSFLAAHWRVITGIIAGGVMGGLINRARGWGNNGWGGTGNPKWLVWAQTYLMSRYVLSLTMGLLVAVFAYMTGHDPFWCKVSIGTTAVFWYMGIVLGWGDYFDGTKIPNNEIGWIDAFIENHFRPWLRSLAAWLLASRPKSSAYIAAAAENPDFIDSVSFGLRDAYYIPLFISLWPLAHGWIALPIIFFWQDGVIYHLCRKYFTGDFVMRAEPSTGDFRTLLMLTAIALG